MLKESRQIPNQPGALAPITPKINKAIEDTVDRGRIELAREQSKAWETLPTFNRTGRIVTVNL